MNEVQSTAPSLVVTAPETMRGQGFVLTSERLTIGRGIENDVRIEDPKVSRRHAVIRWVNDVVTIEDAQSSAGVTVNDARVTQPLVLQSGDRIRLGPVELELKGATRTRAAAPGAPGHSVSAGNEQPGRRDPARRASGLLAAGILCVLAGLVVAVVGYARWVSPILACINRAQAVAAPGASCIDSTGLLVAATGGVLVTVGTVVVIVSMVVKRGARRQLARS